MPSALFTQENIDLVRDYILVGYALEASGWLDSQAFEAWRQDYVANGYYDTLAQSNATAEEAAFNLARHTLPTPVGRAYAEAYDLKRTKEFVEGLTEICGQQARLAYAAKQDDFDYKAFFENRAKMARCLRTPELEQQCILGADKHPSAYVDVNAPAQMFEEFYEIYDVQEGDGMYLAPDARIALW